MQQQKRNTPLAKTSKKIIPSGPRNASALLKPSPLSQKHNFRKQKHDQDYLDKLDQNFNSIMEAPVDLSGFNNEQTPLTNSLKKSRFKYGSKSISTKEDYEFNLPKI